MTRFQTIILFFLIIAVAVVSLIAGERAGYIKGQTDYMNGKIKIKVTVDTVKRVQYTP